MQYGMLSLKAEHPPDDIGAQAIGGTNGFQCIAGILGKYPDGQSPGTGRVLQNRSFSFPRADGESVSRDIVDFNSRHRGADSDASVMFGPSCQQGRAIGSTHIPTSPTSPIA